MKSFGIKKDEKDPRWVKFIEWGNEKFNGDKIGNSDFSIHYGIAKNGKWENWNHSSNFDRIITLDEWEAEFVQPKLAGREYDHQLLKEFANRYNYLNTVCTVEEYVNIFIVNRYAKQDRISEIKAEMEKLSNELKELES